MTDTSKPAPGSAPAYRERLWPSAGVWLAAACVGIGFGLIVARLDGRWAVITALVTVAAMAGFLVLTTPLLEVRDGTFTAGRARIPVGLLGAAEVLDADRMRQERGTGLDARAYLCLRGWVAAGVKVPLHDEQDPTPYWLLSSRHPAALASSLETARHAVT